MDDSNFAFEQVECEYPLAAEAITEWAGGEDEREHGRWLIEWSDGSSRATGIAGLAWMADEYDDEAEVTELAG